MNLSRRVYSHFAWLVYEPIERASPGEQSRRRGPRGASFVVVVVLFVGLLFLIPLMDVFLATRGLRGWSYSTNIVV